MRLDEKDLEKAGPRSTSKSIKYHTNLRRMLLKNRKTVLIASMLLLLTTIFLLTTITSKTANDFSSTESMKIDALASSTPGAKYKDASQLTDYHRLTKLLNDKSEKKTTADNVKGRNKKPIHLSNTMTMDTFTDPWHQMSTQQTHPRHSFIHLLSKGIIQGHTFDELRRLTNSISLSSIFYPDASSTAADKRSGQVPVTAIVHTRTLSQLYAQVQSILTQTALPQTIWIVCQPDQKQEVEARIMTLDRRRVSVLTATTSTTEKGNDWLTSVLPHVATDFVWIIDQNIAPGKRYLEKILKLSFTQQYQSSLLGTEAANVNKENGHIECVPDSMRATDSQMKSQIVDMINDSWLLHRSWLSYLLASTGAASLSKQPLPLGLWISQALYEAGIPSIAIPIDPIERAYWGDVRLSKTQKSQTCKSLEQKDTKELLLHYYQSEHHYHPTAALSDFATTSSNTVLFYAGSASELSSFQPLICKFSERQVAVHIVANYHYDVTPSLCPKQSNHNIILHDFSRRDVAHHALYALTPLLTMSQPTLIIHSINKEKEIHVYKQLETAAKLLHLTTVFLPSEEIQYALWMPDLPLTTLSKWNDIHIKLMVTTTDKKASGMELLLKSIENAYHLGDVMDITVFLEHSSSKETQDLVRQYLSQKTNKKQLRHRIAAAPKNSIFVESWYPSSNHEYAILLNNELELSKFYYIWAKYTILSTRYSSKNTHRNHRLFGISLYSPELLETDLSGRKLFSSNSTEQPYLMQWPSYLGAVYFPEHWREFHDYITARLADQQGYQLQDISLPNLRSSEWSYKSTWRRYFEELIYLRSYVMLYPPTGSSLSTAHIELKKKSLKKDFEDAVSLYNVPLLTETSQWAEIATALQEHPQTDMALFDIWGEPATMSQLKKKGLDLHLQVSACTPDDLLLEELPLQEEDNDNVEETIPTFDPSDILCPFSKVVSVPLETENDTVPNVLPVKEVNVYT